MCTHSSYECIKMGQAAEKTVGWVLHHPPHPSLPGAQPTVNLYYLPPLPDLDIKQISQL